MARTVSQEMSDEERRERLLKGLKATGAEEVTVNISHLVQAVGMNTAEKLAKNLTAMEGLVSSAHTKSLKLQTQGMVTIDRQEAIDAIEAKPKTTKSVTTPTP